MKLVVLISCVLVVCNAGGLMVTEGSNCDTSLTAFTVTSFVVTPNPPKKNENLSLVMTGTMNQANTLKSMEIYVIYDGANFYQESVAETGTYAARASVTITFKVFLPIIAPPGNYVVQVKLTNTAGTFLNCWQYPFTL
jgi:ML domain